jgi:hypothetical protein
MRAYSEDLRRRIVAPVDGVMPRGEAALVFGVGRATVTMEDLLNELRREQATVGPLAASAVRTDCLAKTACTASEYGRTI